MPFLNRSIICLLMLTSVAVAQEDAPKAAVPTEGDYYPITTFETPKDVVLEASSFQMMPNGKMAVASRRGEIWMISDPFAENVTAKNFTRFAHGLHEVLSMTEKDGWLYVIQRPDVSRIRDTDSDGIADEFEVVNGDWGISGDYHEYAFGSKFDKDDNIWVVLCLTGSFSSQVPYRGWCVRVSADGQMTPTCSGVRSPGGIGANSLGDIFTRTIRVRGTAPANSST